MVHKKKFAKKVEKKQPPRGEIPLNYKTTSDFREFRYISSLCITFLFQKL